MRDEASPNECNSESITIDMTNVMLQYETDRRLLERRQDWIDLGNTFMEVTLWASNTLMAEIHSILIFVRSDIAPWFRDGTLMGIPVEFVPREQVKKFDAYLKLRRL